MVWGNDELNYCTVKNSTVEKIIKSTRNQLTMWKKEKVTFGKNIEIIFCSNLRLISKVRDR